MSGQSLAPGMYETWLDRIIGDKLQAGTAGGWSNHPTDSGVTTVICRGGSVLGWGQNNKNRANLGFHGNFEIPGLLQDTLKELGIRIIGFF